MLNEKGMLCCCKIANALAELRPRALGKDIYSPFYSGLALMDVDGWFFHAPGHCPNPARSAKILLDGETAPWDKNWIAV